MKKQFSIFLLILFLSANINAEISGVNIGNLTQLYKEQIQKILVGNKLFGHSNDDKTSRFFWTFLLPHPIVNQGMFLPLLEFQ